VNHGPSENSGPEESGFSDKDAAGPEPVGSGGLGTQGLGAVGLGADGLGGDGLGGDGFGGDMFGLDSLGSDELALRRLMHQAVEEIEPTDGTLEHLRRAVPARRARKRQAIVGMAAAALFVGTAVPAFVHVSNSTGSDADPSIVGSSSSQTQGGPDEGQEDGGGSSSGGSSGKAEDKGKDDKKDEPEKGKGGTSDGTAGTPPTGSAADAPACTAVQLGSASGTVDAPDAGGAVYGTFRIANVSAASCTLAGDGSVSPTAQGAADQAKLGTAFHTAGDAAAALPDPSAYTASLVLQPGAAYEVKFAWVPSEACPTTGGNGGNGNTGGNSGGGDPSPPDPTPTDNATGDSGGTTSEGTTGVTPQLMREDVADGSVVVSYSAEGGAPTASATVPNACAGTIYRTGALAGA
jgi:hypothetical protein